MRAIRSARLRRITEWHGQPAAEVEVHVDEQENPLTVTLAHGGEHYEAVRILHNRADYALDWYDNDLHNAFEDASEAYEANEQWVAAVLATDGLEAALEQAGLHS